CPMTPAAAGSAPVSARDGASERPSGWRAHCPGPLAGRPGLAGAARVRLRRLLPRLPPDPRTVLHFSTASRWPSAAVAWGSTPGFAAGLVLYPLIRGFSPPDLPSARTFALLTLPMALDGAGRHRRDLE
ncbi:MAG: hypothetical protein M0C28_49180, partial [Candidatus Moduliflexus flocculans]|nr:hypothetical protein [Candidatus Moduliflexus flocculans]